ncbi:hypothetical protein, partial [Mesorhizobium sp. P5_C1]
MKSVFSDHPAFWGEVVFGPFVACRHFQNSGEMESEEALRRKETIALCAVMRKRACKCHRVQDYIP